MDPAEVAAAIRANLGSEGGPDEDVGGTEWESDSTARARRGSRAKRGSAGRARGLAAGAFCRRGTLGGPSGF